MSIHENENLIRKWYDTVNQGDLALLDALAEEVFAPDFIEHDPRMPDFIPGPEGVKAFLRQVRQEYTDIRATVHDMVSNAEKTAYRFSLSMTEIASGTPVHVQLLAIARFAGGQIVEEWELGSRGKW